MKFIVGAFLTLLSFNVTSQVDTDFNLEYNVFLGVYVSGKTQWICGMQITATDSTNRQVDVRFDLAKDWVTIDSLDIKLNLDTTQTYLQKFIFQHDSTKFKEHQALKYSSSDGEVVVYLPVPTRYAYTLSNGVEGVSYSFHYANVVLPKKWKKHQKGFIIFHEK